MTIFPLYVYAPSSTPRHAHDHSRRPQQALADTHVPDHQTPAKASWTIRWSTFPNRDAVSWRGDDPDINNDH